MLAFFVFSISTTILAATSNLGIAFAVNVPRGWLMRERTG
jgi:hypothetical protein